jgi:excisionase family DNA binding protein
MFAYGGLVFIFAFHALGEDAFRANRPRLSLTHPPPAFRRGDGDLTMRYDELLTVEEAAERLKVSKHTLNRWRVTGEGPPFVKYGPRLVR